MQIIKINKRKVEILLTLQDLSKRKLSQDDFLSCPIEHNEILIDILDYLKINSLFNPKRPKIIIDCYSIPKIKSFIISIYIPPISIYKTNNTKLKFHSHLIAHFNSFKDLCSFCNATRFKCNSDLFFLNNTYYLHIKVNSIKTYHKAILYLLEFSNKIRKNIFINENAKLLIKDNAIELCKKLS